MPGFIHITDTHIVPEGDLAYGRSDTAAALRQAVRMINEKLPVLGEVECAIVTGDLADHGRSEEYARFAEIMAPLNLPWQAVPGNHDRREAMRAAFADRAWMPDDGPIHWHRDFGAFAVIGLDTLLEDAPYGDLCEDGFAFLDRVLTGMSGQSAVIATHHPWMHSGIAGMDADNLRNGARLMQRLEAHPAPVRMISGHVHRAATAQIGKVTCQIGPAPCHAVTLDYRPAHAQTLTLEAGAVTVCSYRETPAPTLVTDILSTHRYPGPWPFAE